MKENLKDIIIEHKSNSEADLSMENETNETSKSFDVYGKGKYQGSLENGVLIPNGESIIVNGEKYTNNTIPGISNIWLTKKDGIFYDYTVHVQGGCPKGKWDNKIVFQDASGEKYPLRIFSSSDKPHTVNYHSTSGNIIKITWDI